MELHVNAVTVIVDGLRCPIGNTAGRGLQRIDEVANAGVRCRLCGRRLLRGRCEHGGSLLRIGPLDGGMISFLFALQVDHIVSLIRRNDEVRFDERETGFDENNDDARFRFLFSGPENGYESPMISLHGGGSDAVGGRKDRRYRKLSALNQSLLIQSSFPEMEVR